MNSQTGKSIITLLNNINELITISQDKKGAQEVMRCVVRYSKDNSFTIPQEKIENFYRICLDSRPCVLSSLISDIARDVQLEDRKKRIEDSKKKKSS